MHKLFESPSLIELRLIANYLENEGIGIEILNEHQGGNPGVPHWAVSVWAELWVKEASQFERAAKLLGRYQHEQRQDASEEWTCNACKEANPSSFDSCWHCGEPTNEAT
jgi:hypothetical protein